MPRAGVARPRLEAKSKLTCHMLYFRRTVKRLVRRVRLSVGAEMVCVRKVGKLAWFGETSVSVRSFKAVFVRRCVSVCAFTIDL